MALAPAVSAQSDAQVPVHELRIGFESRGRAFEGNLTFDDDDHAVGKRTIVRIEPDSRRPTPWTDKFREQIGPFVAGVEEEG